MDDLMTTFSRIVADSASIVGAKCQSRRTSAPSTTVSSGSARKSHASNINNISSFRRPGTMMTSEEEEEENDGSVMSAPSFFTRAASSFRRVTNSDEPTARNVSRRQILTRTISNNSRMSSAVVSRMSDPLTDGEDADEADGFDDSPSTVNSFMSLKPPPTAISNNNNRIKNGLPQRSVSLMPTPASTSTGYSKSLKNNGNTSSTGRRMSAKPSPKPLRPNDVINFEIPKRRPPSVRIERVQHKVFTRPIALDKLDPETYKKPPSQSVSSDVYGDSPDAPPMLQFRIKFDKKRNMLIVHIVCAKNLPAMDLNGFSDPYVKIYLNAETNGGVSYCGVHQTRVYYKTLNPVFNEAFEIPILTADMDVLSKVVLRLWVYDFDFFTRDDLIGCVTVPNLFQRLLAVPNTFISFREAIDRDVKEEEVGGEILVDLEILPLTGRLNVNIIRLRNISAPGITCTTDDYYFAKLELKYKPKPQLEEAGDSRHHHHAKEMIVRRRTEKCHADMRSNPTDGNKTTNESTSSTGPRRQRVLSGIMQTVEATSGWLEVNFNEQFNFSLKTGANKHSKSDDENNNNDNNKQQLVDFNRIYDYRLKISVYCQKSKHLNNDSTVSPSGDCGLVQSILPSMKHLIGYCTIGNSLTGVGGEHWSEAERAAASSRPMADSHTTITRWHSLIVSSAAASNHPAVVHNSKNQEQNAD